jgi:hypothetical protein
MKIESYQLLEKVISSVLIKELNINPLDFERAYQKFMHERTEHDGWGSLPNYFKESGVMDRWNQLFKYTRTSELSMWIAPHVNGDFIDLLCGDGDIGQSLENERHACTYVERRGNGKRLEGKRFIDFSDYVINPYSATTILLSTVLHHEPDAKALMKLASENSQKIMVVVENPITSTYDLEFQELIDLFFNNCLNETNLPSPGSHTTTQGWIDLAGEYGGKLLFSDRKHKVSGVPIPHDLLVFEVKK